MRKQIWFELGILFFLSLTPLWWFRDGTILIGHDSGFRLNDFSYYTSLLFSWYPVLDFGMEWTLYRGFLFTQFPEFLFHFITRSWEIGQRCSFIFWFFAIGVSMYAFIRYFFHKKDEWIVRLTASMFYMYNFFLLQAWFIGERAKFSLYTALPLVILFLYQSIIEKKHITRNVFLFGLVFLFLNGGGVASMYGGIAVAVFSACIFFTLYAVRAYGRSSLKPSLYTVFWFSLVFVFFNAYWILPQIEMYIETYSDAFAAIGGMSGLLSWEKEVSAHASIINLLRLQGIPDWYGTGKTYTTAYLNNPFLIGASFIPIITIIVGWITQILFKKQRKPLPIIFFLFILLSVGLFFAGGSHPPLGIVYTFFMKHIPGFAIFRSSFYKFAPLVWFSVIVLFSYYAQTLVDVIKNKRMAVGLGMCLLFGILLYHHPFWTADIFRFHPLFTTRLSVPSYVKETADFVNNQTDSNARIMVLPLYTDAFYGSPIDAYEWGFFSIDSLPQITMDRSVIANDGYANTIIRVLYNAFSENEKGRFLTIAKNLGIRYILWRGDAKYSDEVQVSKSKKEQEKILESFQLNCIYENGPWRVYDLGSEEKQMIRAEGNVLQAPDPLADYGTLIGLVDATIVDGEWEDIPAVFEAACSYCPPKTFEKTLEELSIPNLRYQPGTLLFQAMLQNEEKNIESVKNDPEKSIDALLSKANTRLAMAKEARDDASRDNALAQWKGAIEEIREYVDALQGMKRQLYASRLFLFITKHDAYISETLSLSGSLALEYHAFTEETKEYARANSWITDKEGEYKFEFEVPEHDTYQAYVFPVSSAVSIDGNTADVRNPMSLSSGYHRAVIVSGDQIPALYVIQSKKDKENKNVPAVTFDQHNPTLYTAHISDSDGQFLLRLNQGYDKRWKAYKIGVRCQETSVRCGMQKIFVQMFPSLVGDELKTHTKVDGYANGWVMENTGDYDIIITYSPQKFFYIGACISVISIACACVCVWKKEKSSSY